MKRLSMLAISFILTAGLWISTAPDNEVYAVAGCCKQRTSEGAPWYRTSQGLDACKDLNRDEQDNIFTQSGKVWWDLSC